MVALGFQALFCFFPIVGLVKFILSTGVTTSWVLFFFLHMHFVPVDVTTLPSLTVSSRFMMAAPTCRQALSELKNNVTLLIQLREENTEFHTLMREEILTTKKG